RVVSPTHATSPRTVRSVGGADGRGPRGTWALAACLGSFFSHSGQSTVRLSSSSPKAIFTGLPQRPQFTDNSSLRSASTMGPLSGKAPATLQDAQLTLLLRACIHANHTRSNDLHADERTASVRVASGRG